MAHCPVCWNDVDNSEWHEHLATHKRRKKPVKKVWSVECGPDHEPCETLAVFTGPAAKETAEALSKALSSAFYGRWGTRSWNEALSEILDLYGIEWAGEHPPCVENVYVCEVQIINARSAPNANASVQHPR